MVAEPLTDEEENEQPQEREGQGVTDDLRDADDLFNHGKGGKKVDQGIQDVKDNIFGKKTSDRPGDAKDIAKTGKDAGEKLGNTAKLGTESGKDALGAAAPEATAAASGALGAGAGATGGAVAGAGTGAAAGAGAGAATGASAAAGTGAAIGAIAAGVPTAGIGALPGAAAGAGAGAGAGAAGGAAAGAAGGAAAGAAAGESVGATMGGAGGAVATEAVAEGAKDLGKIGKIVDHANQTIKVKNKVDKADNLYKKYGKYAGCCLGLLLMIGAGVYYISNKILRLDTLSQAGQTIISLFHRNTSSGNLQFTDAASQDAIKNGDISESAIRVLNGISSKYKITVNFTGTSTVTGQENQPYEFDITTAGVIDCALGNEKLTPIPVSLSPNYNWSNTIVSGKESASCGVGYYPGLDSPVSGKYSYLDPGVFSLQNITTFGPKASLEESAQVIDDASSINSTAVANTDQQDIPLKKLTLNGDIYNPISSSIETSIKGAYPDQDPSEIIVKSPSAQGIHFEFD